MTPGDEQLAALEERLQIGALWDALHEAQQRLERALVQRIAARARIIAPGAAGISYSISTQGATFACASAIEDADGVDLIDLYDEPELAEQFENDLGGLCSIYPDTYSGGTLQFSDVAEVA